MASYILPPSDVVSKEIPGYPGYWATDDGRIWSGHRDGRFLRPCVVNGYNAVAVSDSAKRWTKKVHRLVALAWHGTSVLPLVRHLDGNEFNNTPSNLAYGTQSDNMKDEIRLGRYELGAAGPTTKISSATARLIVELDACGLNGPCIAARTGVPKTTVHKIVRGHSWPHLRRCPFNPPKKFLDPWRYGI